MRALLLLTCLLLTFASPALADRVMEVQNVRVDGSANRDAAVFDRPERLDLSRHPNPHVGFGGGGRHFCLGAHVARAQLRAIFAELLGQLPDIAAGEPSYVAGNFVHAIRAMPCTF